MIEFKEDRNGVALKKLYFIVYKSNDHHKRHRQNEVRNFKFTTGYVIAWYGCLFFHGAKVGDRESLMAYWETPPYGTYAPWI